MASLTETSILARKVIRYGIYAIIFLIIARYLFMGGVYVYRRIFPVPPPKPTVAFGKLPKLPFPQRSVPENLQYTLETPDGKLPVLVDQSEVYVMPAISSNIQGLENAKKIATSLGFNQNGQPLLENVKSVYVFKKDRLPSQLTMNIITNVFSVSYDIKADPSVALGIPPDEDTATQQARTYLSTIGLPNVDLNDGQVTHSFLRLEGGTFTPAISLSEANFTKVNIFRKGLGKDGSVLPVTPNMPEANVWFILNGARQIVAGEYHYFPIDLAKTSTYPLKTAEVAWEDLKGGKGFIANVGTNTGGNITVRRVYLGYYDAGQFSEFYQPVIVFEGDNGFYGYVPAVTDEFYGKE